MEQLEIEKKDILENCEDIKHILSADDLSQIEVGDVNGLNEYGITVLQLAAITNNCDLINWLLKVEGIDINRKSSCSTGENTALHFAAKFNTRDALKALLSDSQVETNLTNADHETPLYYIQKYEAAEILTRDEEKELLLRKCENDEQNTSLHTVLMERKVSYSDVEKTGLLDINVENSYGITPLHLAAILDLVTIVKLMLGYNETIVDKQSSCRDQYTALQFAAKYGNLELMDVILQHRIDSSSSVNDNLDPMIDKEEAMSYCYEIIKPRLLECIKSKISSGCCNEEEFEKCLKVFEEITMKQDNIGQTQGSSLLFGTRLMELYILCREWNLVEHLRRRNGGLSSDFLHNTLRYPSVWINKGVATMCFEAAKAKGLECLALHSMADSIDKERVLLAEHIIKLFCSCKDDSDQAHKIHVEVMNTKMNLFYEKFNLGKSLFEKFVFKGIIDAAKNLFKKGARASSDILFVLLEQPVEDSRKESLFEIVLIENEEWVNAVNPATGFTLLHTAIKQDRTDVVEFLLSIESIDVNKRVHTDDGSEVGRTDTALHMSVKYGNEQIVKLLINNNADICLTDTFRKPFEIAVKNCVDKPVYKQIALLLFESHLQQNNATAAYMLKIVDCYTDSVNNYDDFVKSALKIFFRINRIRKLDKDHVELFEKLFYNYIEIKDYELVENFLQVSIRPQSGTLHHLVKHSVDEPHRFEEIKNVYELIVKYSVHFSYAMTLWEKQKKKVMDFERKQTAMVALLNDQFIMPDDGIERNVMEYACFVKAVDMVDVILNTEEVIKLDSKPFRDLYDATNLVPDTMRISSSTKTNPKIFPIATDYEDIVKDDTTVDEVYVRSPSRKSFLQILVEGSVSEEKDLAIAQLLDKEPFRSLTETYWIAYRRFNFVLLFLQIIYMGIFTSYLNPTSDQMQFNSTMSQNSCISNEWPEFRLSHTTVGTRRFFFIIWLSWPVFILCLEMLELIQILDDIRQKRNNYDGILNKIRDPRWDERTRNSMCKNRQVLKYFLAKLIFFIHVASEIWNRTIQHFSSIFNLVFAGVAFAWVAAYFHSGCIPAASYMRIIASVMIIGWINTLNYLNVLSQPVNNLLIMLKRIFAKELPVFLIVYIFFYIGFGFSNRIFQFLFENEDQSSDSGNVLFPLIFGISNLATDNNSIFNIDSLFNLETGFIYVYIGITLLVLSNLLIAMINQSYTELNQVSRLRMQYLRFHLIKKSLFLAKLFPCFHTTSKSTSDKFITFGKELSSNIYGNYKLHIDKLKHPRDKQNLTNLEIIKSNFEQNSSQINQLDNNMSQMTDRINDISGQLRAVQTSLDNVTKHNQRTDARRSWKHMSKKLKNVAELFDQTTV